MSTPKLKCAVIGSGNIGTDLMIKSMRTSGGQEDMIVDVALDLKAARLR